MVVGGNFDVLELRWEVYDLFNNKTWTLPVSFDLANTQFGRITNANGTAARRSV